MSAEEFRGVWARCYPNVEPVGYEMLGAGAGHWIRFHSLPKSKRYPDTESEWNELLVRQNELAAAVLGDNQGCWMVQSRWALEPGMTDIAFQDGNDPFRAIADHGLAPSIVTMREPGTEFEQRWEACAAFVTWSSGQFDGLLREIAHEKAAPTLWFSADTESVFAPYDGGVDLFFQDARRVRELADLYPDWLSDQPSGL